MGHNGQIWDDQPRTDTSPPLHDEKIFAYLSRTADPYFAAIRELLEMWISAYPSDEQQHLIGRIRSGDDAQFDAAFWELYLHEAYRRAGFLIDVEPTASRSGHSPDFRISSPAGRSFFVEATSVQPSIAEVAASRRLATLLRTLRAETTGLPYTVVLRHRAIGTGSPSGRKLIRYAKRWMRQLDPRAVLEIDRGDVADLPRTIWRHQGWELELVALPRRGDLASHSFMSMWGRADAVKIDHHTPILDRLARKSAELTGLEIPLVIALLVNTEFLAESYQVERALYGLHLPHPPDGMPMPSTLQTHGDGFWLAPAGFQRDHVPQVITGANLHIGSLRSQPLVWSHPDPQVIGPVQPTLFAPVALGPARIGSGTSPAAYFSLPSELTTATEA